MTTGVPAKLSRRTLLIGSAALTSHWTVPAFSAAENIRATVTTRVSRPVLSPRLYGGFIGHIGKLINYSLWSEVLDDQKFYFGVIFGNVALGRRTGASRYAKNIDFKKMADPDLLIKSGCGYGFRMWHALLNSSGI